MIAQFILDQLNIRFGTKIRLAYSDDEGHTFDTQSSAEARKWFDRPNPTDDPNMVIVNYSYQDHIFTIELILMSYEDMSEELAHRRCTLRLTGVNFTDL